MAEFEECEQELQQLFQRYFLRLHVRDALRTQLEARTKRRVTPISSPLLQKPAENSMPFIPEGLIEDDDDDDDDDDDEEIRNGLPSSFGLDSEIPDIRDEDLMLQRSKAANASSAATSKRPGTATSRIRPTTGRSRRATAAASSGAAPTHNGRNGPGSSMLNRRTDDDSSFGSSDSELDVGDIMGMSGLSGPAGTADDDCEYDKPVNV